MSGQKTLAIIGAGISGLVLANNLKEKYKVTIFEKSRGVGGRMATRYNDVGHQWDMGTQFFTAKTKKFQTYLKDSIKPENIAIWTGDFLEITDNEITRSKEWNTEHPHYISTPKMTSLCKHLSRDIAIQQPIEIKKIQIKNGKKILIDSNNEKQGCFDLVITTTPVHQATLVIPESIDYYSNLHEYKMLGCFSLLLGAQESLELPFSASLIKERDISFISNNNSKPGREHLKPSMTILSTNVFAEENINENIDSVAEHLKSEAEICLNRKINSITYTHCHRWRYANNTKHKKENISEQFFFDQDLGIGSCGDWLGSATVESAYKSAAAISNYLLPRG